MMKKIDMQNNIELWENKKGNKLKIERRVFSFGTGQIGKWKWDIEVYNPTGKSIYSQRNVSGLKHARKIGFKKMEKLK